LFQNFILDTEPSQIEVDQIQKDSKFLDEFKATTFDKLLTDKFIHDFQINNFERINKITLLLNDEAYIYKTEDSLKISAVVLQELYTKFSNTLLPFATSGSGNCLWNMVSICLVGNESLQTVLRLLTVLVMLKMKKEFVLLIKNHYLSTETNLAEEYAEINFQENLKLALENGAWGNMYHIFALSTVLGRSIYIYSFFKTNGRFRLSKNIGIKKLDEEFKKLRNSNIGHHLRYGPLFNQIYPKLNNSVLYGFFDGTHYTALIPKKKLKPDLFKPVNSFEA
jgi:hypothetical protein